LFSYWQIVQIVEDDAMPGYFRLWIFLDSSTLKQMLVKVPRTIYVNTRVPNLSASEHGRRVERILPRGRPCLNLYELTMDEYEFIDHSTSLSNFLNHTEVEGVYETQVPLLFRTIMEIGCVCKIDKNEKFKNEMKLSQLQYKTTTECPYLQYINVQKLYLYHSSVENRGIFGLFLENSTEVFVVVITPKNSSLEKINFKNMWKTVLENSNMDLPNLTFIQKQEETLMGAYQILKQRFTNLRSNLSQPTILLTQTSIDLPTLYAGIPSLKVQITHG
jgi:DNA polymerase epsilon subunit 1